MLKYIPNLLTASRIAAAPVFVALYLLDMPVAALAVFIAGSVTDVLDGFIARRCNCVSSVGKALDPLADKITLISILACLFIAQRIPVWMLLALTARELLMIFGGVILWQNRIPFSADRFGKITTVLFFSAAVLLFPWHDNAALKHTGLALMLFALLFSLITFGHYYRLFQPMLAQRQTYANK